MSEVRDWWQDECDADEEPMRCYTCGDSGRLPSPDYLACMNIEYVACPDCEEGLNSGEIWE